MPNNKAIEFNKNKSGIWEPLTPSKPNGMAVSCFFIAIQLAIFAVAYLSGLRGHDLFSPNCAFVMASLIITGFRQFDQLDGVANFLREEGPSGVRKINFCFKNILDILMYALYSSVYLLVMLEGIVGYYLVALYHCTLDKLFKI